jgi:1-acyl-sn-glycerol-3-phosphate acyltransferase
LAKSGVTVEVEGQENIPEGPFILACKHQSAWETIFLLHYLNKPVYVLKKELMYIPIYGWYLPLIGMIPIERGSVSALKKLKIRIRRAIDCGRPIVIFPEGTRVAPGDSVDYRPGIYVMHQAAPHVPIVPAALNSGLCWPRGTFSLRPGVIKLRFLPQMQGKFSREYLLGELKKIIDKNINSL